MNLIKITFILLILSILSNCAPSSNNRRSTYKPNDPDGKDNNPKEGEKGEDQPDEFETASSFYREHTVTGRGGATPSNGYLWSSEGVVPQGALTADATFRIKMEVPNQPDGGYGTFSTIKSQSDCNSQPSNHDCEWKSDKCVCKYYRQPRCFDSDNTTEIDCDDLELKVDVDIRLPGSNSEVQRRTLKSKIFDCSHPVSMNVPQGNTGNHEVRIRGIQWNYPCFDGRSHTGCRFSSIPDRNSWKVELKWIVDSKDDFPSCSY